MTNKEAVKEASGVYVILIRENISGEWHAKSIFKDNNKALESEKEWNSWGFQTRIEHIEMHNINL